MAFPRKDYIDRANRRAEIHSQGIKGMFILNGGGIISLLTFYTQIIIHTPELLALSSYIIWAMAFWGFGLVSLAPINHLRYETSRLFDHESTKEKGKKYGLAHRILFYTSLSCFVVGLVTVLIGLSSVNLSEFAT